MIAPLLPSSRSSLVVASACLRPGGDEVESLRRAGWEVRWTGSGCEARRLVRLLTPAVVVLDTELTDESGWLTCAKLLSRFPDQAVVLVTERVTPTNREFARLVGAQCLVARSTGWVSEIEPPHRGLIGTPPLAHLGENTPAE